MAIQQVISNFPPAPNSATDTPIDFNAKADAFVNHQSGVYTPEVNTWADQANTTASEVNTNATSAEASATEATTQADRAEANAGTTFPNPVFPQEEGYILTAREDEGNTWEENITIGDVGSAVDNIFTGVNSFEGQTDFDGMVNFNNVPRFNTYPRTDGISTLDGGTTHDIANMGIEYGSNANGTFMKYPDGTLICTHQHDEQLFTTASFGALWRSTTEQILIFPEAFVGAFPIVSPIATNAGSSAFGSIRNTTLTQTQIRIVSAMAEGYGIPSYIAIGRWK